MSYIRTFIAELSYPSAEKQLVYSTAPVDWAINIVIISFEPYFHNLKKKGREKKKRKNREKEKADEIMTRLKILLKLKFNFIPIDKMLKKQRKILYIINDNY